MPLDVLDEHRLVHRTSTMRATCGRMCGAFAGPVSSQRGVSAAMMTFRNTPSRHHHATDQAELLMLQSRSGGVLAAVRMNRVHTRPRAAA